MLNKKTIWITWENHTRTINIANSLGVKLFVLDSSKTKFFRYYYLLLQSIKIIHLEHPEILIVQNPSLILTFFAIIGKYIFNYKIVVDAHNEAINPYIHNNFIVRAITRNIIKMSDITIVTNKYLAETVKKNFGSPFILPDKIPEVSVKLGNKKLSTNFNIVYIATFALDEPYKEIFDAVNKLESNVTLYVTGNYKKLPIEYRSKLSKNIVFTGYLDKNDYWSLLKSADAIIDLTKMEDCLVCGAYEAVSVGKPLILSNNRASIDYFPKGVIFCNNSVEGIKASVSHIIQENNKILKDISILKKNLENDWNYKKNDLLLKINNI